MKMTKVNIKTYYLFLIVLLKHVETEDLFKNSDQNLDLIQTGNQDENRKMGALICPQHTYDYGKYDEIVATRRDNGYLFPVDDQTTYVSELQQYLRITQMPLPCPYLNAFFTTEENSRYNDLLQTPCELKGTGGFSCVYTYKDTIINIAKKEHKNYDAQSERRIAKETYYAMKLSMSKPEYFPLHFGTSIVDYGTHKRLISFMEPCETFDSLQHCISDDDMMNFAKNILLTLKQNNLIHRDIKMDNIVVCNGMPKLIDFGFICEKHCMGLTAGSHVFMHYNSVKGKYDFATDEHAMLIVLLHFILNTHECNHTRKLWDFFQRRIKFWAEKARKKGRDLKGQFALLLNVLGQDFIHEINQECKRKISHDMEKLLFEYLNQSRRFLYDT